MNYANSVGGLSTDEEYPYTSIATGRNGACESAKIKPAAKFDKLVKLPTNDYNALKNAVATIGPISVMVASERMSFYGGGVFDGGCGTTVDQHMQ